MLVKSRCMAFNTYLVHKHSLHNCSRVPQVFVDSTQYSCNLIFKCLSWASSICALRSSGHWSPLPVFSGRWGNTEPELSRLSFTFTEYGSTESTIYRCLFMCKVCAFLSLFDLCICICCHLYIVSITLSPVGDYAAKLHSVDAGCPWPEQYQIANKQKIRKKKYTGWFFDWSALKID